MKIGITCYPTYGGSGVIATELGKGLARKGHKVHFITYREPARLDTFDANIYYHEVRFADYPLFEYTPYETALASRMVDIVLFEKLDLLHVHYAIPHASAAFMAKQILLTKNINIPIITTLHGTDITLVGKDPTYSPVVTFSINRSDGVTAPSQNLKEETYSHFDIDKEIEVIPNFVDFSRFSKSNKDHFKKALAPNGEKVLVHTSNFRPVKRVLDVVRIFDKVRAKIPSKLLLIGDGPERQKAEILCRELGNCNDVRFLGKQDAIEELLAIADVFIMPSESESFGLAALEAMAVQVPVISSNTGGIPEINIDGNTGFTSNVGDVEEMSKNAIALLSDEELLTKFRENAFKQSQNFNLDKVLPLYEDYYSKIVEQVQKEVPLLS
ncbi:MAG: N-acetyl-alpha-D-glucosaminyl L-malate synthase BshA [Chitinophagales bacterium]|nr:N-acetyl-alpha-D-glucosaminyl L-malate synthase BshA [Chitinophagales bacterium]